MTNVNNSKKNNAGFTLIEMVVTFALLGIFMVAAARVISYTVNIYYVARGNSYGYEVSYLLANKVRGQLENAGTDNAFKVTADGPKVSGPIVSSDNNTVKFVDSQGSIMTILAENNRLVLRYDQVSDPGSANYYKELDWKFDENAYMGYELTRLQFYDPGADYPDNVIKMQMNLHNPQYGDFATTYYIKCYNIEKIEFL